mgnify:CR=1 FL=1|jgi:phage baseplate assembly protein W|tara:strand:+ start:16894 stop:17358 length:465 start_codon:yes stop_codon:yes gene_type:complete
MTQSSTVYGATPLEATKNDIISYKESDDIFGVRYPLYIENQTSKGIFKKTKGFELLKSQLRQFIRTERGERVMLPNFGLSLQKYLFEPLTADLVLNIRKEIIYGITSYIPEASIISLDVVPGGNVQAYGLPGITISLVVTSTNTNQQTDLQIAL